MIMSARANTSCAWRHDLGAGAAIFFVRQARAKSGVGLDQHAVSGADQLLDAHRQKAYAIFIRLDFLGDSDNHECAP